MKFKSLIRSLYKSNLVILFLILSKSSFSQKHDRIWLFADSSGIDFNDLTNPVAIKCNIGTPCLLSFSSIANQGGELLFYVAGNDLTHNSIHVFDKNGNVVDNGDSLIGHPWVGQGVMIIPFSTDTNKYYVFVADRNGANGNLIYFSVVDMSLNGGLGSVISRDNLLLMDYVNEKLNATKHANGRDWWIIVQSTNTDSLFHKFLIVNDSINGPFDQYIGSGENSSKWRGQMIFSKDGSRMVTVSENSTIDVFDFDRCTGDLYNYKQAGEGIFSPQNGYFGCSLSPNGNVLYASSIYPDYKYLYQYDLTSTNILSTKKTILHYPDTGQLQHMNLGQHLLGPDDKIYIAKYNGFHGFNADTYYTQNMDVILNPDSLDTLCNYRSCYFSLGTSKTVLGLPTMLNYNLGPVTGSICDTLSIGVESIIYTHKLVKIYPNVFASSITISSIYPINGRLKVRNELGKIQFDKIVSSNVSVDLSFLANGIYFLYFETKDQIVLEKIIKIN